LDPTRDRDLGIPEDTGVTFGCTDSPACKLDLQAARVSPELESSIGI